MRIHKYNSIEEYKKIQEDGNKRKIDCVFVNNKVVETISKYIKEKIPNPSFGICHGTRRGVEQSLFSKNTGATVIGTEISSTATQFPDTIQWDFHDTKPEWINNIDFIYSNSIDHSHTPELALSQWLKCLNDNGMCFIEYTVFNKHFSELDCFAANKVEMLEFLKSIGDVVDIIRVKDFHKPRVNKQPRKMRYIVFVVKKKDIK